MRRPMIRKTTETRSEFAISGFMLTEKAKASLRARGLKTDSNKWTDVFKGVDVVYKWNVEKQKSDVFVGQIYQVKYASGKTKNLDYLETSVTTVLDPIVAAIPVSKRPTYGFFRVSTEGSHRVR